MLSFAWIKVRDGVIDAVTQTSRRRFIVKDAIRTAGAYYATDIQALHADAYARLGTVRLKAVHAILHLIQQPCR
jgi:hypothetical protein